MTSPSDERPRQVTLLGWTIVIGSVFVVLFAFQTVSGLQSLATREAVEKFLAEPPGDGLGLDVAGALDLMRWMSMAAAACAAATGILGWHVMRRNRSARLGLTILALPLAATGMVLGGFMSAMVMAASLMLWLAPAKQWLERTAPVDVPVDVPVDADAPMRASGPWSPSQTPTQEPAAPSTRQPWQPPARNDGATGSIRPPEIRVACFMTWIFSALAILGMIAGVAYLATNPEGLLDEMRRQNPEFETAGVSDQLVLTTTYVLSGIFLLWAFAAIALAALVWRGVGWARILLIVSTFGCVGLCLLGMLSSLVMAVPLLAAILTVRWLASPASARFCRSRVPSEIG
ncbi:MAG: hypothetical protein V9G04_12120 [Nocardioides sp.]